MLFGRVVPLVFASSLVGLGLGKLVSAARLVDFQVAQPPPVPENAKTCEVEILEHTFGNSYGSPAIVSFTPPTDCGEVGSWAGITLNLTVTSNGTQYDRLGILTFQNVEIWRTSTPEPVSGDGIIWTYVKDVTRYLPLFATDGTFIFELDNILTDVDTGQYATTLSATFYESSSENPTAAHSDLIIPLSTLSNDTGNDASVPPAFSLNVTVPTNAIAAYAELYASGNSEEEFWYYNVANDYLSDLPSGTTYGDGPFREVRILVDGMVAGVAFPYAVIFTGGIVPAAWRPIAAYGALDLPTYFLDLTPFIPILTDGSPHNITLDVVSAESNHTINSNWYVSGLLQIELDSTSTPTTGNITKYEVEDYAQATSGGSVSASGDLTVTVGATRSVRIESEIWTGSGGKMEVVFEQELQFENVQSYVNNASIQIVTQTSKGSISSTHNGVQVLKDDFSYPLWANLTFLTSDEDNFTATIDHSYERSLLPSPFILGSDIQAHQIAGGTYHLASTGNTGSQGTSNNTFSYSDDAGNTYSRQVGAYEYNITYDTQSGSLAAAGVS